VFGPEIDPASLDETVRRRSVELYRHEAELARQLGARAVVVHPSVATDEHRGGEERRETLTRSAGELDAIGKSTGVNFLLENLPGNYGWGGEPAALAQLIRELGLPHIGMCFDVGHAHMTGSADAALDACRDTIQCVHVHDNDGKADSHELPGDGTIDFRTLGPRLASLPDEVALALEIFPTPEQLRERLAHGYGPTLAEWFGA
jgi:sugar phosphate isomerase/epimerase